MNFNSGDEIAKVCVTLINTNHRYPSTWSSFLSVSSIARLHGLHLSGLASKFWPCNHRINSKMGPFEKFVTSMRFIACPTIQCCDYLTDSNMAHTVYFPVKSPNMVIPKNSALKHEYGGTHGTPFIVFLRNVSVVHAESRCQCLLRTKMHENQEPGTSPELLYFSDRRIRMVAFLGQQPLRHSRLVAE